MRVNKIKKEKKEKLTHSLDKKIASVKKKIKKAIHPDEKKGFKKQLAVLIEFKKKLE